jgi:hypothetical protein
VARMADTVQLPDPHTCTHDQWEQYLAVVDVLAMDVTQVEAHRAACEAYSRRLRREHAALRELSMRAVERRELAYADAEDLSGRRARLHDEALRLGDVVLDLHRLYGPEDERVVSARRERDRVMGQLGEVQRALMAANEEAVAATQAAR